MRTGTLAVSEAPCHNVRRLVRTAHLTDGSEDLLPPLRDVVLIAIEGHVVTLSGYEAKPSISKGVLFQRSWLVRVLTHQEHSSWKSAEEKRPGYHRQTSSP